MNSKHFYNFIFKSIILSISLSSFALCQIPNGDFENWTNGNPDNWSTTNNTQFTNVIQSTDAYSGTYSVKGEVYSFSGFNITPTIANKFVYTGRPSSLTGYYKFASSGSDTLVVVVATYKSNVGIAGGIFRTAASANSYTKFTVPMVYNSQDNPDSAAITIYIAPTVGAHSGSVYYADNLAFSNVTAVNEDHIQTPISFELKQNYPNPFNPSTTIEYQIPEQSHVVLNVYNVLGSKVAELVNEKKPAGNYSVKFDASELSSGVYFYRINAGNFIQIKKLIVLK